MGTLSFSTMMLSSALKAALDALAEIHQNKPGQWLDDLERNALAAAKDAVTEGISEEQEAGPALPIV